MYNNFFGLAEAPFNITPDSKFLFLSERHREALGALLYGIQERKGFILLTGEIGSGKTTICRALVHDLRQENVKLALILNPGLSEIELLKAINDEFQIPSYYNTKKGLIDELNRFLIAENQKATNVVLIIDEAQTLDPVLLEQVRMLSNLETEDDKLIQIVLIGQPELNETMALTQLEQLNQRIAVRNHIHPLSPDEMYAYIKHRLFVARAKIDIEFTEGALRMVFQATRGIPRKINVLCDRALLGCYAEGSYTVDEHIMEKSIQEVSGEMPVPQRAPGAARRTAAKMAESMLTRRTAFGAAVMVAAMALVAVFVAVGIHYANVRQAQGQAGEFLDRVPQATPAPQTAAGSGDDKPTTAVADAGTKGQPEAKETPEPAPTPKPNYEELRRKLPNWKYERKDVPLVRVNNPRLARRAAQFSLLKTWGIAVNLDEMTTLSEDLILNGELHNEGIRIIPLNDEYYRAIRYNVPLMVRLKDTDESRSEYVVLLRAEGEAVTVGDPVWGVKTYKTQDFIKKWQGAWALSYDVHNLGAIKPGDRSDHVRTLQQYLKDHRYLDRVSGVFDVDTTEAIRKLQAYFNIEANGKLDGMTLVILNSRMMHDGPRLNAASAG